MKFLLLLAIIVVAYLLWRNARLANESEAKKPTPPAIPQDMVRCPVCSLHLPRAEAVTGSDGLLYCSQEHRLRAGA